MGLWDPGEYGNNEIYFRPIFCDWKKFKTITFWFLLGSKWPNGFSGHQFFWWGVKFQSSEKIDRLIVIFDERFRPKKIWIFVELSRSGYRVCIFLYIFFFPCGPLSVERTADQANGTKNKKGEKTQKKQRAPSRCAQIQEHLPLSGLHVCTWDEIVLNSLCSRDFRSKHRTQPNNNATN